ncbi:MAG TPA: type I-U CRISPR-associated RAMP protein Csb1/Cas7u [Stellaceae bacterium]|nr:type I-U CRISPR-associated RAMP protein Csb1/Cas7u [Stellaceae bacterium]
MDIGALNGMLAEDAALRRRQVLQPVGGKGDKIFPPTYPGEGRNAPPRHVYERRRLNGADIWCVLVDSVQSQANRLEECLLAAIADGIPIPYVEVDFTKAELDGISKITSLDAPHRVYDAILRDSLYNGIPFMESDVGQRLAKAKAADASALLETSPTALLFGAWHSTGQGGGLGAKFSRCLISEIVGVDVPVEDVVVNQRTGEVDIQTSGRRTGSRIDPLGVLRKVRVFKGEDGWSTTKAGAGKNAKEVRPSEINHGNIAPSVQPLGVTCDHIEHSVVLSFAALRRLHFGGAAKDGAGRSLLMALGLVALAEQDARGYALRSRCDLVCDGRAPLEIVHSDGSTETIAIDRRQARALYNAAYNAAREAGFTLSPKPLELKPQDKLVEIVRESQKLALALEGGDEEGTSQNESHS